MANYKESGVDVEEGYRAVNKYKEHAKRTAIPGLLTGLGSFNGMFEIPKGYKNPVMVSGTDGVGTKLDVAFQMKKYDTVGINSAKNAAYLALQILALNDKELSQKLKDFRKKLADDAAASGLDVKF